MLGCVLQSGLSMDGMPSCNCWGWTCIGLNASGVDQGIRYIRLR